VEEDDDDDGGDNDAKLVSSSSNIDDSLWRFNSPEFPKPISFKSLRAFEKPNDSHRDMTRSVSTVPVPLMSRENR